MNERVTTTVLRKMKREGVRIAMLTAYDYLSAEMLDEVGMDVILVGDSVGMVVAGYENSLPVTMDMMVYHTEIVSRAVKRAMVVGDMPFLSYQVNVEDALRNAGRLITTGAQAIKVEGGRAMVPTIRKMIRAGIPVMGHIGLTPQSVYKFGGFRLQGKSPEDAQRIFDAARSLEDAGVFALILEKIPQDLARRVTESLAIPTIGIGAGPHCDGQVLIQQDMLGIFEKFRPRFVKHYAEIGEIMREAFKQYMDEVRDGTFPADEHSYE